MCLDVTVLHKYASLMKPGVNSYLQQFYTNLYGDACFFFFPRGSPAKQ